MTSPREMWQHFRKLEHDERNAQRYRSFLRRLALHRAGQPFTDLRRKE